MPPWSRHREAQVKRAIDTHKKSNLQKIAHDGQNAQPSGGFTERKQDRGEQVKGKSTLALEQDLRITEVKTREVYQRAMSLAGVEFPERNNQPQEERI